MARVASCCSSGEWRGAIARAALAGAVIAGCAAPPPQLPQPVVREIPSPAGAGALGPNLAHTDHGVFLSWLEPEVVPNEEPRHALRVARLEPGSEASWSPATTVTSGGAFFANWADFPAVTELRGGLLAHWLERIGEDDYAYGVRLARSLDHGATWQPLGFLHDDQTPAEHGFVSFVPLRDGAGGAQAFWLDGREMAGGGPMTLRTVRVPADAGGFASALEELAAAPASTVLDARVCECCQTDAALAAAGPVVVYRDRSDDEVRDIFIVRATGAGWSEPRRVAEDDWRIPGCPVNGPAVAASEQHVVVAWFTGAGDQPAVKVVSSTDGGASFGEALVLDAEAPLGRVDVAIAGETSWVSWLARSPEGAAVRLAAVDFTGGGTPALLGPPATLAATGGARSSGFPRTLALDTGRLLVTWVDTEDGQRVRTAQVDTGLGGAQTSP
jgi:hypothetical protein